MFLTQHAENRIRARLSGRVRDIDLVVGLLEGWPGKPGTVAYICLRTETPLRSDDGSNGDTVIAIAVDGSIETVYFRRSADQDLSASYFGAAEVVDITATRG